MSLTAKVKRLVEHIPYPFGRIIARVPFSVRLGSTYLSAKTECAVAEGWSEGSREQYAVAHFRRIFEFAREEFPCYRKLYEKAGVLDLKIETLADIKKVPRIDKKWTREHFAEFKGAYRLNTGGSSGEPTAFWMDKDCWAREWAHMHTIWEKLGYRYTDIKLTLRGRSHSKKAIAYNPVHNEYVVSPYIAVADFKNELLSICRKRHPKWIHGYPSVIYQFMLELEKCASQEEVESVLGGIRGLMLSSEFPMPYMLEKFKKYGMQTVSWYGHSEMCILAYSVGCTNHYRPFATYGLAEVDDGHLIGTSYHNFAMPLIRYDTGDLVGATQVSQNGRIEEFAIKEGRNSDFILDRNGKPFSLNSLMIGRHHHAFDVADYVQVEQTMPGKATFLVCCKRELTHDMSELFDIPRVDVEFDMRRINKPIRTAAGKLKLRV